MYNAAIIGAGQLGSRHLQGLKTASLPFDIWVMDNSDESLSLAEKRYDEVPAIGEKRLHLVTSIDEMPDALDFVVVATGSMPRASIVKSLLKHAKVKYLILEKVLFPKLDEYDEIEALLKQTGTACFVNCARRMFGVYHTIHHLLDDSPITMEYDDVNWGLCCNSIHFIDIFMMLNGENKFEVDTTGLIPVIENSKRNGYVEFFGKLAITTPRGNRLFLRCRKDGEGQEPITITTNRLRVSINESTGILDVNDIKSSFRIPYQSETTGLYADMLLKTGFCSLAPYSVSARYHRYFLKAMLDFYNEINNNHADILPIT